MTVVANNTQYTKGAPDYIIAQSTSIMLKNGEI